MCVFAFVCVVVFLLFVVFVCSLCCAGVCVCVRVFCCFCLLYVKVCVVDVLLLFLFTARVAFVAWFFCSLSPRVLENVKFWNLKALMVLKTQVF